MIDLLNRPPARAPAIVDTDKRVITYGELLRRVQDTVESWNRHADRTLTFLYALNTVDAIVAYLACLSARRPLCLLEPTPENMVSLVNWYIPSDILLPAGIKAPDGYRFIQALPSSQYQLWAPSTSCESPLNLHPDLALLLQTSGTTGNPKLVRLTESNLKANARSIVTYLGIMPDERSIQGLPFYYSYGLSLVNSHFLAGGAIVLTSHSFMMPDFWRDFRETRCMSFAGVPYMYETLHRLGFDPKQYPMLRTMTQAGGGLRPDLIREFHRKTQESGARFFVMYGQTEATARISYVPPDRLGNKVGSIGIAIPEGHLSLMPNEDDTSMEELVYRGPNVMLGYAEDRKSLANGDNLKGLLKTGDLARVDEDGFFYLVGRLKRIAKIFGSRINLLDVEANVESVFPVRTAALDVGDHLAVYVESEEEVNLTIIQRHLARYLRTTPKAISVVRIPKIPMTNSGKKDYKAMHF